jgi:hypothetical protein
MVPWSLLPHRMSGFAERAILTSQAQELRLSCVMLIYHFTIHNVDRSDREEAGRMALRDDNAARAFGKSIIRDIMNGNAVRYVNWTMNISSGFRRDVCRLSFAHYPTPGVGRST